MTYKPFESAELEIAAWLRIRANDFIKGASTLKLEGLQPQTQGNMQAMGEVLEDLADDIESGAWVRDPDGRDRGA